MHAYSCRQYVLDPSSLSALQLQTLLCMEASVYPSSMSFQTHSNPLCCFVLFFTVHYKTCFRPPPAGAAVALPRLDSSALQKGIALGLQPAPVVCVPAWDWCIKQRLGALCTMKGICASPGHISQQTCKTSKNHNSHFMPLQRSRKLHGVSDKTAGSRGWNKCGEDDTRGKERGREFKRVYEKRT